MVREERQIIPKEIVVIMSERKRINWEESEVKTIVKDYFLMLTKEINGESYKKSNYNRQLIEKMRIATNHKITRSRGSVEYKLANISAVLVDLGLPFIDGYKPRFNYQNLLFQEVNYFLDQNSDFLNLLEHIISIPGSELKGGDITKDEIDFKDLEQIFVPPPEQDHRTKEERTNFNTHRKFDFDKRERKNRILGKEGERFIIKVEKSLLDKKGLGDLKNRVEHVSETRGDGAGYDILSFNEKEEEKYIEVKTTNFNKRFPFFITVNELKFSKKYSQNYNLYRVYNFWREPKIFILEGGLESYNPLPSQYKVFF